MPLFEKSKSKGSAVSTSRRMPRTAERSKTKDVKKKMKPAAGRTSTTSQSEKPPMAPARGRTRTSEPSQLESNNGLYDELNGQNLNQKNSQKVIYAQMPGSSSGESSGQVQYTAVEPTGKQVTYAVLEVKVLNTKTRS